MSEKRTTPPYSPWLATASHSQRLFACVPMGRNEPHLPTHLGWPQHLTARGCLPVSPWGETNHTSLLTLAGRSTSEPEVVSCVPHGEKRTTTPISPWQAAALQSQRSCTVCLSPPWGETNHNSHLTLAGRSTSEPEVLRCLPESSTTILANSSITAAVDTETLQYKFKLSIKL